MPATTRILAVGAIAGIEPVWRKFINTIALDVYKIDAAVLVGGLGVAQDSEARRWMALADERLADSAIELTIVSAGSEQRALELPDGRRVPICSGTDTLEAVVARERCKLAICGGDPGSEPRKFWVGDTLCLDPGSDTARGGLCGYVADLVAGGVMVAQPVRT
ncbi:MAG: hypothetical protein ACR2NR_03995 [Solirubrobacteraceae bacterium]